MRTVIGTIATTSASMTRRRTAMPSSSDRANARESSGITTQPSSGVRSVHR